MAGKRVVAGLFLIALVGIMLSTRVSAQDGTIALPTPTITYTPADSHEAENLSRLQATPLLYNMTTDQVRAIFKQGQQDGNRAQVFTFVGDSNSTGGDFLHPIGLKHNVCDLGAYAYLEDTIKYFSVPPLPSDENSFTHTSVAAVNGLSSAAALDPLWADHKVCGNSESPVSCEYRLVKPSVLIIMLGLMDLEYFDVDAYHTYMERLVQYAVGQGVIPVLTTLAVMPDYPSPDKPLWSKSLDFNMALLDIADTYGVPVIHMWGAQQSLPDLGIGPDRTHLKAVVGEFCSFNGPEREVGGTLRNLLTLQALDALRQNVLSQ